MPQINYVDIKIKHENNKWFYTKEQEQLVKMTFTNYDAWNISKVFAFDPAEILDETQLDVYRTQGAEFDYNNFEYKPNVSIISTDLFCQGQSLLTYICNKAKHHEEFVKNRYSNHNYTQHFAIVENSDENKPTLRGFVKYKDEKISVALNPEYKLHAEKIFKNEKNSFNLFEPRL